MLFNASVHRIVYLQYLSTRDAVSYVYADQFAIINIVLKLFAISTQTCFETCTPVTPSVNDGVSDALLNAAVQNV